MPTISGTVYDDTGAAVAGRVVRAYRRDTGALLAETQSSDGATGDPSFANVSLLLHMDGANGSTTFTDSSPTPKIITANGNVQISTAQSKFGGASGYFDGSGDYLTVPSDAGFSFGSGDWTVEFWLNTLSSSHQAIVQRRGGGFAAGDWLIFVNEAGVANSISVYAYDFSSTNRLLYSTSAVLSGWSHVAIVRNSSSFSAYVGGVQVASNTASFAISDNSQDINIGRNSVSGQPFNFHGYIDDLRITKGVARYTANFTPPAAPFPNSASSLPVGEYEITTSYTGECNVLCLDDSGGTTHNDLILRTTPV